jgi:hypothetical protein
MATRRKEEEEIETDDAKVRRKELEDALKTSDPYEKLKKQVPPRHVELPAYKPPSDGKGGSGGSAGSAVPPVGDNQYKTISQAMESSVDLTDMQYALRILMPKKSDYDNPNYDPLLVADVSPEVFLPGIHLTAMNEIMQSNPKAEVDVTGIYMKHYTRWSIPLDREGRMDVADIAGAARAEKKLQSTLGLKGYGG